MDEEVDKQARYCVINKRNKVGLLALFRLLSITSITHHIAVVMPQQYGIAIEQGSMAGSSTFTLKILKSKD